MRYAASILCVLGAVWVFANDTVDLAIAGGLGAYLLARAFTFWPVPRPRPPKQEPSWLLPPDERELAARAGSAPPRRGGIPPGRA